VRWIAGGQMKPNARAEVVHDRGAVMVVDGGFGLGQPVAREAVDLAIGRAKELGVCCLALRNSCHIGRIGTYGEQCANAGLISMHYVNVIGGGPAVAPYGGREPRMLTNPYCCAIPRAGGEHVVLDFATSELLGGALAGQWTLRPERRIPAAVNNMLAIVIDPDAFGDRAGFETEAEAMLAYIRSTAPAEGFDRVRLPGDPERESMAERLANGIPIDDNTWAQIRDAAASVGINDIDTPA
jgi:uncharacterized oxidoreductase